MKLDSLLTPVVAFIPENNRTERIWKLAQVDFKKRYYNNKLGLLWAYLNPLLRVSIYSIVFTYIMPRVSEDIPNFAIFIFCVIIFWMEFVQISKRSMKVMYTKKYLIENINVHKTDLFYSITLSSILSLCFNLMAFIIFIMLLGVFVLPNVPLLCLVVMTYLLISTGIGMILAWVYIYLKDLEHIYDMIILLGFWTSGVFFDPNPIIQQYPVLNFINPFIGLHANLRAVILDYGSFNWTYLIENFLVSIIIISIGKYLIEKQSHEVLEHS